MATKTKLAQSAESTASPPRAPSVHRAEISSLLVAVFLSFLPALSAEFLNWDDNYTVVDNPQIQSLDMDTVAWAFSTFSMGHYQPLSWLSLALDHAVWGLSPFGFHLSNLLLHSGTATLVLLLLRWLFFLVVDRKPEGGRFGWIFWATLLWAVHPMRVESVVWVTERRDVLSGLLLVATVVAYLKAREGSVAWGGWRLSWWLLAIGLFALSLLAKAAGVVLPVVLVVLEVLLFFRFLGPSTSPGHTTSPRLPIPSMADLRKLVVRIAPFALLAGAAALVAPRAQAATRALVPLEVLSLGERLMVACYGFIYYLWRLLWPIELSPLYELPLEVRIAEPRFLLAVVTVLTLAGCLVALFITAMRGSSRRRRTTLFVFAIAVLYTCLLLPVLGFFQSGMQLVADRYSYLPSLVLAAALVAVLRRLFGGRRQIGHLLCALFAFALMVTTFTYSLSWRSTLELWQSAVEAQPGCAFCREGLGTELLRSGELERAEIELTEVLVQRPNLPTARRALAALYDQTGRLELALEQYRLALQLTPENPVLQERIRVLSEQVNSRP